MKTMKDEIELRLIGSLLSDWCKQQAEKEDCFIYRSGFDSTHRVIRITTPMLQSLFALPENQKGQWANGNAAMYEIHNSPEGVTLTCTVSTLGLGKRECARLQALAAACDAAENKKTYRLAEWNISDEAEDVNSLTEVLDQVLAFEVAWFESELTVWKDNPGHVLRAFPKDDHVLVSSSELPEEIYTLAMDATSIIPPAEKFPEEINTPSIPVAQSAALPSIESLIKRAYFFLEDEDFEQAITYFNRVLDIDPEHAPAYIGLLCAENKLHAEAELAKLETPIADMLNVPMIADIPCCSDCQLSCLCI